MKTVKRIVLAFLALIVVSAILGYFYFDRKFTPEKNYLTVQNESGKIPIVWEGNQKNALLVPIKFEGDTLNYFLQFDTGSPYTVFYKNSAEKIKQITLHNQTAKSTFSIGQTKVFSTNLKVMDYREKFDAKDSVKIIGTLGADILEDRKTILNLRDNYIEFNLSKQPSEIQNKLFDFKFKKRKIIIPGILQNEKEDFLYDSGTSAYELLSSKEVWNDLKTVNSKISIEKTNSWQNTLTTYTAKSDVLITFNQKNIPLKAITYVEGFSKIQYLLMKFSGMTGMLGNTFFLENTLYFDCSTQKIVIQ